MESALSPNTAAFLQYISSQLGTDESKTNDNEVGKEDFVPGSIEQQLATATSLPPSAFFQIPETSNLPTPQSKSVSPLETKPVPQQHQTGRSVSISESEEGSPSSAVNGHQAGGVNGGIDGLHKRKAGLHHQIVEDDGEEDESDSDAAAGHEDKRQHHNTKAGRKGGRKSGAGDVEGVPAGKEMSKAARRKEQNRAAQKAFRERREARVSDLEAKVADLEAKSYSSTVENENLRSILKRLQEENVSLKQSAFTFAMPRGGSGSNASPNSNANGASPLHRVSSKPPTPPYSQADEQLKSINDPSPINTNMGARPPHRQSSSGMSGMATSPESLNSAISSGSSRNPLLNGNSPMRFDSFSNFSNETGITPPSVASDNKSDLEALWASFYPGNNPSNASNANNTNNAGFAQQLSNQQGAPALASPNPLTQFLAAQLAQSKVQPTPQSAQAPNMAAPAFNPSAPNMAYRDPTVSTADAAAPAPDQEINWGNMGNTSIDEFLAALTGSNNGGSMDDNPVSAVDDDTFNQQLQAILAGGGFDQSSSGGNPVSSGVNAFSPTNYLNMSPTPLNSISNSASPQSALVSGTSNSASPESSSNASSVPPKELSPDVKPQATWSCGEIVNVVDENGNVIKPSDLWVKMGMQQQDNVDNLLIDDLCDQMRAKAKCTDNGAQLSVDDLNHMMSYDKSHQQKRMDDLKDKYGWGAVFGSK